MVFEVGLKTRDDTVPPDFFFSDGGGVVELLIDVEDGEEGVFKVGSGERWPEVAWRFFADDLVRGFGIVSEGRAEDGRMDNGLLAVAESEGLGEFLKAWVGKALFFEALPSLSVRCSSLSGLVRTGGVDGAPIF